MIIIISFLFIGTALSEILEALFLSENIYFIDAIPTHILNLETPLCDIRAVLIYLSIIFLVVTYETIRSARRLRLVLQSSIIYFLIDIGITQGISNFNYITMHKSLKVLKL